MGTKYTLTYFFNEQFSFYYETASNILDSSDNKTSGTGVSIPITLLNNNSLPVMSLLEQPNNKLDSESIASYYTLNKIFLSGTSYFSILNQEKTSVSSQTKPNGSKYQLILQGYLNDYNNNQNKQILIILPIFTNVSYTKQGSNNSVTTLNNTYLNDLLNIHINEKNNVVNGINVNQLLSGASNPNLYKDVLIKQTTYTIVQFKETNLWADIKIPNNITLTNPFIPSDVPKSINIKNNGKIIETSIVDDIYIDCSPTNNLGEPVDMYTSKNLDQLNFFKIDNFNVWGGFILAIVILIAIVFGAIKIFEMSESNSDLFNVISLGKLKYLSKPITTSTATVPT